jgi:hypothetical protein
MAKCIFCDGEIPANNPDEHIILNAIGGRLKTNTLVCGKCNSRLNDEIDNVLADQLNPITNLLNVKRERGGSPAPVLGQSQTMGTIKMMPGGKPEMLKPEVEILRTETEEKRTIKARSGKELRKHLQSIAKDGHKIDVEDEIKKAKHESVHPGEVSINGNFGGAEAFRSVCKTALLSYLQNGGDPQYVKDAIDFVNGKNQEDRVGLYQSDTNTVAGTSGVTHSVSVRGDSSQKRLYSYVEYYGAYGFAVSLNDNYQGPNFESTYCFDVLEQKQVANAQKVSISGNQLDETIKNKKYSLKEFEDKGRKLLGTIAQKHAEDAYDQELNELTKKHFPVGTTCTKEQVNNFSQDVVRLMHKHGKLRYEKEP